MKNKNNMGVKVKNSNLLQVKAEKFIKLLNNSGLKWYKTPNTFSNNENFINGIKYISELASPGVINGCIELLDMISNNFEAIDGVSTYFSFFCEVGVWENNNLKKNELHDADFSKYLISCMHFWFSDLYDFWLK